MGEARRRKDEIAAKQYKGKAKDLPRNQVPKKRLFQWEDPMISTRRMTEIVQESMKDEEAPFDLINPENERVK